MEHSEKTVNSLERMNATRKRVLEQAVKTLLADNRNLYPFDLVLLGIVKRCESTSAGIEQLVRAGNLTCARAVLRMHLDTVLRLSAFWLSDNPQKMALEVMEGNPIRRMKDRNNTQMTDSYLANVLGNSFEWIPKVYRETSGYIHFSEKHLAASVRSIQKDATFSVFAGGVDEAPEFSWVELLDCATECLRIVMNFLKSYEHCKGRPPGIG